MGTVTHYADSAGCDAYPVMLQRQNAGTAGFEPIMPLHIATSWAVGPHVRRGMRISVPFISDGWLMGPCAFDPEVHLRLRPDFWSFWPAPKRERASYTASFRRILTALAADEPVVIWSSPDWNDRVAVWAFCSYRLYHRPTRPDLSLVVVGELVPANPPLLFEDGYLRVDPALARQAWETKRSLSLNEVREKARFWRKLTAPSPILSGKPLRETNLRKELFTMGTYQAGFFPRQTERGLIVLSTLDALLLGCANKTPSNPANVLMRRGSKGEELRRWMHLTGDISLFERLAQWAKHTSPAALHAEPYQAPNGWLTARYTLTDTGRAILRDGLTSIDQAPPLPIWGVTAYDPKNPWVVVESAEGRPHLRRLGE